MKFKFGVTTFPVSEMRPEKIVLSEPNYISIHAAIDESKRKVLLGKKIMAGLLILSATILATKLVIRKTKPNLAAIKIQS